MPETPDAEESSVRTARDAARAGPLAGGCWGSALLSDDETFDLGGAIRKPDIHAAMTDAV